MFYLKQNLPRWERTLRVALGMLIAAGAVASLPASSALLWAALAAAATLALTGFVGFCPACAMAGRKPLRKGP
ncbi:YgaP family membrane protein [Acidovorax sp. M2(2025)]|uniref:YgaP family membrane protein n=1 Tax=Acidovorax sp. M2(2025) TaxID=3411355 RepID=UPI003BF4A603